MVSNRQSATLIAERSPVAREKVVPHRVLQEGQSPRRVAMPVGELSSASWSASVVIVGGVGILPTAADLGPTTMTDEEISLRPMLEKGFDTTLLRGMKGFAASGCWSWRWAR